MTSTVKVLANTVAIGTSNNAVSNAKCVRILNADTARALVTIFDTEASVQIGTVQLVPNEVVNLVKKPTDALTSNNASLTLATPIALTH